MNKLPEETTESVLMKYSNTTHQHLEVMQDQDRTIGYYWGIEENQESSPIYFWAPMKDLSIEGDKISFHLNQFHLFNQPVYPSREEEGTVSKEKIPSLLKFDLRYSGDVTNNQIKLVRVSDLYDSRFDEIELFSE